jgi:OFA family oxalate/formate antiporter-like MFS transporter
MTEAVTRQLDAAGDVGRALPLKRLRYPLCGILMMLCIGNVYAWSVFRNPLMKAYGWTMAEATYPFQISIAVFAVAMVFAGRWQDKSGPRPVAMLGGILIGAGFILAGLFGATLTGMIIAFGVIAGIGMGGAYVTPLATTMKWWPDKRGRMTGLVMLGMGAGAVIGGVGAPLLIERIGLLPTFIVLGVMFGVIITAAGAVLKTPPPGTVFGNQVAATPGQIKPVAQHQFTPGEMLSTPAFYFIWFAFVIGCGVGLMVISQASPIGQELAGLDVRSAGIAIVILSVFNGLGRLAFGVVSDKIGRKNTFLVAFALEILTFLLVLPNAKDFASYAIGVSLIGATYGAFMGVMPSITADYFGTKNIGVNYAWVYTAWGAAGILGPMVGVMMKGAWVSSFYLLAGICVVGMIIMALTHPPAARKLQA